MTQQMAQALATKPEWPEFDPPTHVNTGQNQLHEDALRPPWVHPPPQLSMFLRERYCQAEFSHMFNPIIRRLKHNGQTEVSLGNLVSSKLMWTTQWDTIKAKKQRRKLPFHHRHTLNKMFCQNFMALFLIHILSAFSLLPPILNLPL